MNQKRPLDLLAEEKAKKFKKLFEYNFYLNDVETPISEDDEPKPDSEAGDDIDLDSMENDLESDLGLDGVEDGSSEEMPDMESPEAEQPPTPEPEPEMPPPMEEPATDEVEIDVTEIIKNTEDNNRNLKAALSQLKSLEVKLGKMDAIGSNMTNLELQLQKVADEIKKRNPTPNEKIEMRSMDSFPYNTKLSSFWGAHSDKFSSVPTKGEKPEEYVLKQSDIDNFSERDIRKSFSEYDEEDIY